MSAATAAKSTLDANEKTKAARAIDQPSNTGQTLRRLTGYMIGGEHRSRFVLGTLLLIVALAGLVTLPFATGQATNVISDPEGTVDELTQWAVIGAVAGAVYLVMSYISGRIFADIATKGLYKLQTHLFTHMQSLSLNFFDRVPIGELLSRVSNDSEVVALYFEQAVSQLIRAVLQIIIIVIVMLLLNPQLTFVALLTVPVMLGVTYVVMKIASPAFEMLQSSLGVASGFQEETLSGHKVIISKRRQDWAAESHEELATEVYDLGSKAFFASLMQFPLTNVLTYLMIVLVLVVGALMVIQGNISLGIVMAFSTYASLLASPVSDIASLLSNALNAVAGANRIFQILDEEPQIVDAPDAVAYEFKGGHVEFQDVDFSYVPGRKILKNNTFDAAAGESIGICGPTGAGKSTIINIMTRYYDTDSGNHSD